MSFDSAGS